MEEPKVTISTDGNGNGDVFISVKGTKLKEREPGRWFICDMHKHLPMVINCGGENLQLTLVLKMFCKARNRKLASKRYAARRLKRSRGVLVNQ